MPAPQSRAWRALASLAALALIVIEAAAASAAERREAVVLATVENMYSRPDESADVVSQAVLGQIVGVVETQGEFARIETPDRYPGWITRRALRVYGNAAEPRYASRGALVEVVSLIANVYREPDVTTARPKTQATLGVRLELAQRDAKEGWHAVRLPAGDTGYIHAGDVSVTDAATPPKRAAGEELVGTARRFLGLPYLWGGMTPLGLDCSGFVAQVYRTGGVVLPRDADLQFDDRNARPVERAELRPGDLVFFGRRKITHVGVYAGDGRFVHATTHATPRVQESRLGEPYWSALYRGARRPR
jgi:cell wall-associated NlpC family hydrolase